MVSSMADTTPTYENPWPDHCIAMVRCGTPQMGRCRKYKAFGPFCTYHALHRPLGAHEPKLAEGAPILNGRLTEIRSKMREIALEEGALPETRAMILMQIRSEALEMIKELKD